MCKEEKKKREASILVKKLFFLKVNAAFFFSPSEKAQRESLQSNLFRLSIRVPNALAS